MCHINYCIFANKKSCLTSKRMQFAEFSTVAKSLPPLRWNTHKSLILSYSEYFGRIFEKNIVSTVERHKKWQETTDKMANPLCVGIETTSFRPRRTERRNCGMIIVFSRNGRCRKQRFLHDSIRKGTRNSVAKSKPQGEKVETMYPNWFQQVSINGNNAKVPWRIFWSKWRGVSIVFIIKT